MTDAQYYILLAVPLVGALITVGLYWNFKRRSAKREHAATGDIIPIAAPRETSQPSDEGKTAVPMPQEFVRPKKRNFDELAIGESGYVGWTCITVDDNGRTFVFSGSDGELKARSSSSTVQIRREKTGFVLALPRHEKFTWEPRKRLSSIKYYPVIKIEQEN